MSPASRYRRVLLKLSGEALMGSQEYGIDPAMVIRIAGEISQVHSLGCQICLVVGGGNIYRGLTGAAHGMERAAADYMGMMATVINSLALQNACEKARLHTRVLSAIPMQTVCEPYIRRRAVRHMEKGRVVIFAAGTGNPFFTTDTAAALRASEMGCDALLKGTKVEGVYDADPEKGARRAILRAAELSGSDMRRDLKVMDTFGDLARAGEQHSDPGVLSSTAPGAFAEVMTGNGQVTLSLPRRRKDGGLILT